jgi:hypothetical protein
MLALAVSPVHAQSAPIDLNGNVMGPAGGSTDTPGAVITTFSYPIVGNRYSDLDTKDQEILAASAYDNASVIYRFDWYSGALNGTVPTDTATDFGVGWDSFRQLYITTSNGPTVIKGYDGISPTPVFTFPSPVSGCTGIAYDGNRDWYWTCNFSNNTVNGLSASTGALMMTYPIAAFPCTNPAGLAYDPTHDELVVGGRVQHNVCFFSAATGALRTSFLCPNTSLNNPQGVATFRSGASAWISNYSDPSITQVDNGQTLSLQLGFATPGAVTVSLAFIPAGADCRLFFDVLPGPYTGAGPFGGATVSLSQIVFTLSWPIGVPPFSTVGSVNSLTYGPFPGLPPGLHLNAFVVDFVGTNIEPPISASGGTVLRSDRRPREANRYGVEATRVQAGLTGQITAEAT